MGKGGVPQGDFLRAKGSERSFSPQRWKRSSRTFRRRGNVSFADKGVHPGGVLIVRQDTSTAPPGRFHPPFGRISHAYGIFHSVCSKGADRISFRAIPHNSARESDERICVRKRWKTAGILCVFQGQYRINRQESLTKDFSSEKGVKPQEYSVYFKVLQTNFWRKRSVKIRRRICAVLPKVFLTPFWRKESHGTPAKAQQSTRKGYAASVAQQSC